MTTILVMIGLCVLSLIVLMMAVLCALVRRVVLVEIELRDQRRRHHLCQPPDPDEVGVDKPDHH